MLKYVKKFTIFALISVGVSFVLFLFFGNADPRSNSFEINFLGNGGANGISGLSQPLGIFNGLTNSASEVLGISFSNNSSGPTADVTNLTEIFGQLMAGKIIEGNPSGSQPIDGADSLIIPGDINLADPAMGQKFTLAKNQILYPAVDETKFHIKETLNKDDLNNYIVLIHSSYGKIVNESAPALSLNVNSTEETLKNYEIIGHIFEEYAKALYGMEVPAVFKEFHKKITVAALAQINIANAVLDHQADPLKATLVGDLQNALNAQYKKLAEEEMALVAKYGLPVKLKLLITN